MAEQKTNVQLTVREIYAQLCPKCKKKLRDMIKERITDSMVNKVTS